MKNGRGRSPLITGLLAAAMLSGGGGAPFWPPDTAPMKHDPKRPKNPADLERMAAAQAKRDRKAKRRPTMESREGAHQ